MLQAMPQTEAPAGSDVQIDQVGFESAPGRYSSVGGCHGSINEPDSATTEQSQAEVGILHYGNCLVAAFNSKEIRTTKEHGLIAEQETGASVE